MDQIFLEGDFSHFTARHWGLFLYVALYTFFGLKVAQKSIRLWTTPGNNVWWARFLYPFTVLRRKDWDPTMGMMRIPLGKYRASILPFFYDLMVGERETDSLGRFFYFGFHMFFWPLRALLNIVTVIGASVFKPVVPALGYSKE